MIRARANLVSSAAGVFITRIIAPVVEYTTTAITTRRTLHRHRTLHATRTRARHAARVTRDTPRTRRSRETIHDDIIFTRTDGRVVMRTDVKNEYCEDFTRARATRRRRKTSRRALGEPFATRTRARDRQRRRRRRRRL